MVKKIIWRKKAKNKFREIVFYLQENWSEKVAGEFVKVVLHKIDILTAFPRIGIISVKKEGFRKLILSKHNMLVYRIKEDKIILLNIYDTRQDPVKIDF